MNEQIGIELKLLGYKGVLENTKFLEKSLNKLEAHQVKITIEAETRRAAEEIRKLQRMKQRVKNHKFYFEAKVDGAKKNLASLQRELDENEKGYKNAKQELKAYLAEIKRLRNTRGLLNNTELARTSAQIKKLVHQAESARAVMRSSKGAKLGLESEIARTKTQLEKLGAIIDRLKGKNRGYDQQIADLQQMRQIFREMEHGIEITPELNLSKVYRQTQTLVNSIGASLQAMGGFLTRVTSPGSRIVSGALYGAGYKMMNTATEGLESSLSRYDTLKTFPKIMASLGFDSKQASKSVNELNDAVIGLPTGLDEIVDMAKRYALATGSMEKGTKYAIAANNAFLASAATDTQKYQGMLQLNDIFAGKKLQNREWMSLAASMPAAIDQIGKKLGYKKNADFLKDLYAGKIAADKFADALVKVGTGQGKIAKMAAISKTTFQGITANLKNAFSRGGFKVLEALDDVLTKTTGKDVIGNMALLGEQIDKLSTSAASWIRNHPEDIMKFFDAIKSYNWGGLASGFAKSLLLIGKGIAAISHLLPGGAVGRFLVIGNVLGRVLTVIGGAFRGSAAISGGIAVLKATGKFGKLFDKIKGVGSKAIGVNKAAKGIDAAGTAIGKAALSWKGIANKGLSIAAPIALTGSFYIFASSLKKLEGVDVNFGKVTKSLGQMVEVIGVLGSVAAGIGFLTAGTGPIGWLTGASMGIGLGVIAGIAGDFLLLSQSLDKIGKAKVPSSEKIKNVTEKIGEAMTSIMDMYGNIDTGGVFGSLSKRFTSGNLSKFMQNFNSIVDVTTEIIGGMSKLSKAKLEESVMKKATENIQSVAKLVSGENGKGGLFDTIEKIFPETINGSNKAGGRGIGRQGLIDRVTQYNQVIDGIRTIFTKFTSVIETVRAFKDKYKELEASELFGGENGSIQNPMADVADFVWNMAYGKEGEDGPLKKLAQVSRELQGMDPDSITTSLNSVTSALTAMANLKNKLMETGFGQGETTGGSPMSGFANPLGSTNTIAPADSLTQFTTQVVRVVNALKLVSQQMAQLDPATFMQNAASLNAAMDAINNFYVKMQSVQSVAASMTDTSFITNISTTIGQLRTALMGAESLQLQAVSFQLAVNSFTTAMSQLASSSTSAEGLGSIPSKLNAIGTAMDNLGAKMSSAGKTWKSNLLKGFDVAGIGRTIKSGINRIASSLGTAGFSSAGSRAGRAYASAFNAAAANIHVPHIGLPSGGVNVHTGGLIGANGVSYFSKGGRAGFRPKGTDTIPAMLTKGEYVMKRRAVNAFGAEFMQKVNRLDLPGALHALSIKTGSGLLSKGNTYITNNYSTNNNQKVTQNVYTDNPGFANAKMGRWVGALR